MDGELPQEVVYKVINSIKDSARLNEAAVFGLLIRTG